MSNEAKVGAFALAGLVLLLGVIGLLSGLHFGGSTYRIYTGFTQVVGIKPQSPVRISGVPAGRVTEVANDGVGVTVTMEIDSRKQIPRGSRVTIVSNGVMGEKFINILPVDSGEGWVADGDYLIGEDETGVDTLMSGMSKVLVQVEELMQSANDILGDEAFKGALIQTMANMQHTTANLDHMISVMETITVENQGQIRQIISQLNMATAGMAGTMQSADAIMANIATVGADPQTAENLRQTLSNISDASGRIVRITEGLENIVTDEQLQQDLKATVHNARKLTEKADGMLGDLKKIEVRPQVDVMYSGGAKDWKTDFNVDVGRMDSAYVRLGVDDIGDGNDVNAQVGKRFSDSVGLRGGVVNGQLGAGIDFYAGERFQLSAEGYDPDEAKLRLEAAYDITGNGTSIVGQWDKVNDSDKRRAYVGLRQSF